MPSLGKLANVMASYDPIVGLHYKLSCYVCGHACITPSPFEGWATFQQIFTSRPDGCRFAIVRKVPVLHKAGNIVVSSDEPMGDWLVWDLLDTGLIDRINRGVANAARRPPLPMWQGDTEQGMTMKAMALYGKET